MFRAGRDVAQFALNAHFQVAAQLNVGAAACHVGGDGDRTGKTCVRDDEGFLLVVSGVQDVVLDMLGLQQLGKVFRLFNRHGTHQDRLVAFLTFVNQVHDGVVFFLGGTIDHVVLVVANTRAMGGDFHHFQLINFRKFARFRHRRAGHASQLRVHAEVVLERNRGKGLVFVLDGDAFLGFQCLVQTFGKTPTFHHATGKFVDDDDLVVLDDVVGVAGVHLVSPQGLVDVLHQRHVG